MKIKDSFITHESDGRQILIDASGQDFHGLVRSNKTASFIVDCLMEEIDREALIAALTDKYEVSDERAAAGVDKVLTTLRGIGALDE